jgi:hypothetical protein|tara:strand:- start:270 stop:470 length:201 start_codon:yes stop_codon:yes gene_type:complete
MQNDAVSPQGVIDDLADQVKRLSIDNAVLRTALKQIQQQQVAAAPDGPPAEVVKDAEPIADDSVEE